MDQIHGRISRPMKALLMLAGAAACASAMAAGRSSLAEASAIYRQERTVCTSGRSNQDRATCLREADAAFAEAKKGGLDDASAPYARHASQRCERLPGDDRKACIARMQGQGTTRGDAASGGISRELVTQEPAPASKTEPAAPR